MNVIRPVKTLRITHRANDPNFSAYLQVLGEPGEVRMGVGDKTFISVRDGGISLSPGIGNNISIQGMPQNIKFGGMLANIDFPLSVIPITPFNPLPIQRISPPMNGLMSMLSLVSTLSSLLPGAP
jgi:hypothetical protein